ncbi:MAG: HAMP domain-containing histidine kinase [Gemmatimonadetes bacterium]|nr:HAMP domain-containing histidine kinase [Gemmatimonadota bacterium]MCC6771513.1 HAMP domain-containing histidine kinase [Gemmatimonadaceae bacterium]
MNQERSLVSVIAALFERLAARALALFALCVVIGFALLSEVLSRNALARSADVIESLLGMYADPSGEPTTVAPDMLTSALLGMGDGARFVILRTVSSADGMPKVYYLSPGMPAKLIEEAGKAASPDELRQRIVGSVADRGWRYALYHRQSAGFDLYVSASRLPSMMAIGALTLLMLVVLPVAVLLSRRAVRRTTEDALQPLHALVQETRAIVPSELNRRVTSPTGIAELTDVGEAINAMVARVEQAHEALTRFTADVSHELRTPLTHLRAQAQWALDDRRTTDEQRDALAHIATSVDQTCRLIEGLLTLARGDSRELDPRLRDFDLSAVVAEVAEIGTLMCGDKQVTVSATCTPGFMAHGDAEYTRQILLNFVSNSARHTAAGSIDMTLRRENGAALAEVSDSGSGIAPQHLPRIFDRFYRVEQSRSRDYGGAGLGLAITRALAEAQRGDVRAESVEGSGSTFVLDLPSDRAQWEARGRQALA